MKRRIQDKMRSRRRNKRGRNPETRRWADHFKSGSLIHCMGEDQIICMIPKQQVLDGTRRSTGPDLNKVEPHEVCSGNLQVLCAHDQQRSKRQTRQILHTLSRQAQLDFWTSTAGIYRTSTTFRQHARYNREDRDHLIGDIVCLCAAFITKIWRC
jgi:hypothetical protein